MGDAGSPRGVFAVRDEKSAALSVLPTISSTLSPLLRPASMSKGVVAAIAVGVGLVAVILSFLLVDVCLKRRQRRRWERRNNNRQFVGAPLSTHPHPLAASSHARWRLADLAESPRTSMFQVHAEPPPSPRTLPAPTYPRPLTVTRRDNVRDTLRPRPFVLTRRPSPPAVLISIPREHLRSSVVSEATIVMSPPADAASYSRRRLSSVTLVDALGPPGLSRGKRVSGAAHRPEKGGTQSPSGR